MNKVDTSHYSGIEKASVLMMSLEEDVASKIFAMMTEDEIREISKTMSGLGKIDSEVVNDLLGEFSDEMGSGKSLVGDISSAKKILTKALGEEKVEDILGDLEGSGGVDVWDALNNTEEAELANYLNNEHPQTVALILSKIKSAQAAKVLSMMDSDFAIDVLKRIISIEPVKNAILNEVEKVLQTQFVTRVNSVKKASAIEQVAEIFNNFDRSTEGKFFELLEKNDPDATERIRELMFTFDDLAKLDGQGVQVVIRSADKEKLPLALKGANDEIKTLFFDNMSERAAKLLKEDIEALGPVKISDVDEAQLSVVQVAKQLSDSGEITIPDGSEESEEEMIY